MGSRIIREPISFSKKASKFERNSKQERSNTCT